MKTILIRITIRRNLRIDIELCIQAKFTYTSNSLRFWILTFKFLSHWRHSYIQNTYSYCKSYDERNLKIRDPLTTPLSFPNWPGKLHREKLKLKVTCQYVKTRYTSSIIGYFISFFPVSLAPCYQDSLVFWIPCCVFRIPSGFWIPILNFRFHKQNFPGFWMPQYSSRIPESGVPYMGRQGRAISL